jgi:K(+)-stimulated pyrophosphate-energized sodium pump
MGMLVVGLGIVGLAVLFLLLEAMLGSAAAALTRLAGFGFGASSIALFARVGGGIYTKAADVGADLVGKVGLGSPCARQDCVRRCHACGDRLVSLKRLHPN